MQVPIISAVLYGEPMEKCEHEEIKYHEYSKKIIVTHKIAYSSWVKDCVKQINGHKFRKMLDEKEHLMVECHFFCSKKMDPMKLYEGLKDILIKAEVIDGLIPHEIKGVVYENKGMPRIEFKIK